MSFTTRPNILMQMNAERQALIDRAEKIADDSKAFSLRWKGFVPIPSAPASATIYNCRAGTEFVKIEFGNQAAIETFTLETDIAESGGRIVVFDTDKTERSLASLSLLPDDDGIWREGCMTVVDSVESIGITIKYLIDLSMHGDDDDYIDDAVALLIEHLRVKHGYLIVMGRSGGWGTLDDI